MDAAQQERAIGAERERQPGRRRTWKKDLETFGYFIMSSSGTEKASCSAAPSAWSSALSPYSAKTPKLT